MFGSRRLIMFAAVAMLAILPIGIGGCLSQEDAEKYKQQAIQLRETIDKQIVSLQEQLLHVTDTQQKALIENQISAVTSQRAVVDAGIKQMDQAISALKSDNPFDTVANNVIPWIPEPYKTPAMFGVGILGMIWRNAKLKGGIKSLAKSIQTVVVPALNGGDPASSLPPNIATKLDAVQTNTAKAGVDAAQADLGLRSKTIWTTLFNLLP